MPKKKPRRGFEDYEWNNEEENYANTSGDCDINNSINTSATNQGEGGDGNNHANERNNGGTFQQTAGSNSSPPKHKHTLRPWIQATSEAVRDMGVAQHTMKKLEEMITKCTDDFDMIDDTTRSFHQLEEDCREKDKKLQMQEDTISILRMLDEKSKASNKHDAAQNKKDRDELEFEKTKQAKRIAVATEETKLHLEIQHGDRIRQQNELHEDRMQELERKFADKNDEINKRVQTLEIELTQSISAREEQKTRLESHRAELEETREKHDTLTRAKDSLRQENIRYKKKLDMIQKEFALDTRPISYFKQKFTEIYVEIERISIEYFHDVEGKDLEKIHEELTENNVCFKTVPIDESYDSFDLRTAHAQRIISGAILEEVWKPLFDELTLPHPEFSTFLRRISDSLEESSHGGRTSNVWTALTMRTLQPSSQVEPMASPATDRIISKVLLLLSPLINPRQSDMLRRDLSTLVKSAAEVWYHARASGLKITASQTLDRTHYADWRSPRFEPVPLPHDFEAIDTDVVSKTHLGIFTLFPKIVARGTMDTEDQDKTSQESSLICIHSGIGLPERAALVVRGRNDQVGKEDHLRKVMEDAKKEIYKNKRGSGQGRRNSRGSSMLGPHNVSDPLKKEGTMKYLEK